MKNKINYLTSFDGEKLFTQEFTNSNTIKQHIFLSHGLGGDSNALLLLVKKILKEVPNTCCVVWDSRGHGLSTNKFPDRGSIEYLGALDLQQIIKKYQPKQFFLLGHSLGGLIALSYFINDLNPQATHTIMISTPINKIGLNFNNKFWYHQLCKSNCPIKKKRTLKQFIKNQNSWDFDLKRVSQDIKYSGLKTWILEYLAVMGWQNKHISKCNSAKVTFIYSKYDLLLPAFLIKRHLKKMPLANSHQLKSNHHQPPLKNYHDITQILKKNISSNT